MFPGISHCVLLVGDDPLVLPLVGVVFPVLQVEGGDLGVRLADPFNQVVVGLVALGAGFEVRVTGQSWKK